MRRQPGVGKASNTAAATEVMGPREQPADIATITLRLNGGWTGPSRAVAPGRRFDVDRAGSSQRWRRMALGMPPGDWTMGAGMVRTCG